MLDIDYFKKINDTYGHAVGDETLKSMAKLMKEAVKDRENACTGRWGGEEFMVLVPDMGKDDTCMLAEKLRQMTEEHAFGCGEKITISLGVIAFDGKENLQSVYITLDDALYSAKKQGRNRVVKA